MKPHTRLAIIASSVATFLLGALWIYFPVLPDLRLVAGDAYDARIQIAIMQHWYNVLIGHDRPLAAGYFFPLPRSLGYNDGYVISGVIYSAFRALGLDPFVAHEAVNTTIRAIGFSAMMVLAIRFLRMPLWAALLSAFLALVSNNLLIRMGHAQILYAHLIPAAVVLLLFLLEYIKRQDWLRSYLTLIVLVVFFTGLAATTFYPAYFFALLAALYCGAQLALSPDFRRHVLQALKNRPDFALFSVMSAALPIVVLFVIYGTSRKQTGGHGFDVVSSFQPSLFDLINVGPHNWIWSTLVASLNTPVEPERLASSMPSGFPIVFLIVFLGTLAALVIRVLNQRTFDPDDRTSADITACALAIASAAILLLIVQVGGISAWYFFWRFAPGAEAIRIPLRFLLFLTPIVSLVIGYGLFLATRRRTRAVKGGVAIAVAFLIIEQLNTGAAFHLDRRTEAAFLSSIPGPPPECRSFYVSVPRPATGHETIDTYYLHSVDAMLIAASIMIPTINGMATFLPPGWELLRPLAADYPARVEAHRRTYALSGLCGLNLRKLEWQGP